MLIVVDAHSGVPVYRQLIDQIRFQAASGLLRPGDELPSTRVLSAELGINPMTVSKAYSLLEREGVVERRPGLPLLIAAPAPAVARARRSEELRKALAPAVTVARQLEVPAATALDLFRDLLATAAAGGATDEEG